MRTICRNCFTNVPRTTGCERFTYPVAYDSRKTEFRLSELVFCRLSCVKSYLFFFKRDREPNLITLFSLFCVLKHGLTQKEISVQPVHSDRLEIFNPCSPGPKLCRNCSEPALSSSWFVFPPPRTVSRNPQKYGEIKTFVFCHERCAATYLHYFWNRTPSVVQDFLECDRQDPAYQEFQTPLKNLVAEDMFLQNPEFLSVFRESGGIKMQDYHVQDSICLIETSSYNQECIDRFTERFCDDDFVRESVCSDPISEELPIQVCSEQKIRNFVHSIKQNVSCVKEDPVKVVCIPKGRNQFLDKNAWTVFFNSRAKNEVDPEENLPPELQKVLADPESPSKPDILIEPVSEVLKTPFTGGENCKRAHLAGVGIILPEKT